MAFNIHQSHKIILLLPAGMYLLLIGMQVGAVLLYV